ncbi:MAG TPA: hypothetical protein VMZ26_08940 [Pyrinomonadaceae bacterium]|nr:hypothetical protein [Pyrinomonadaceae bacterium]
MERLVLGLIAVIGLHTAFVVYMAGIRWVDENTEMARSVPARTEPGRVRVEPIVDPEVQKSVASPQPRTLSDATTVGDAGQSGSRTSRLDLVARSANIAPKRSRISARIARTIPAFPARTLRVPKNHEMTFGDRVIVYKAPANRLDRSVVTAQHPPQNINRKRKNNSLVAKLQWVYKKPWGLMKSIGSKLR